MFGMFLSAENLSAGWKISRVDRTDIPYIHIDRDTVAYTMDDDLMVYRMSTGQKVNVTHDEDASIDIPLTVQDGIVWFRSTLPGESGVTQLRQYLVESSRINLIHTTESDISLSKASSDAGRLVVEIDHDWWLWDQEQMEQITYTGADLTKDNPCLSGDHLLWRQGQVRIFVTDILSKESTLISDEGLKSTSLRLCGEHAAWVSEESSGRYWIMVDRFGDAEAGTLDMSDRASTVQMHMDEEGLVYVKSWGSFWFIMHFRFQGPSLDVLLQTSLPLESPFLYKDRVYFLAQSCSTGMCLELFALDVTTGVLSQITTYGNSSYVTTYGVGPQGILFWRFLVALPWDYDILEAKEVPGLACATMAEPMGNGFPSSLFLLLAPALFARALLLRLRRST